MGGIAGLLLPVIGFYLSFLVKARGGVVDWEYYKQLAFRQSPEQQDILIFCLIPNLLLFYFSNFKWQLYAFTKGLVLTTVILLATLVWMTY